MSKKPEAESYTDKEAERRAIDALRRALTTPYKPQSEMVGRVGHTHRGAKKKNKKKT